MENFLEGYFGFQKKINQWQRWKQLTSVRLLLPSIFGILGFYIVWEMTRSGPSIPLGGDADLYLWASKSLYSKEAFLNYSLYPILYPILVSIPQFMGMSIFNAVSFVGALGFGILMFFCSSTLLKYTHSFFLFLLGSLTLLLSYLIIKWYAIALTDGVFTTLLTLFLIYLLQVINAPTYKNFFLLGILAALCSLQKYIGTISIAFGCLIIMLPLMKITIIARIKYFIFFGFIGSIPLALLTLKELYFMETIAGGKGIDYTPFSKTFLSLYNFLLSKSIEIIYNLGLGIKIGLATIFFLILMLFFISIKNKKKDILKSENDKKINIALSMMFIFPVLYLVYLTFLRTFVSSISGGHLVVVRYYLPSIPLFWLFFVIGLDQIWQRAIRGKTSVVLIATQLLGIGVLVIWFQMIWLLGSSLDQRIIDIQTNGWTSGYSNQATRKSIWKSELTSWLRKNKLSGNIIVFGELESLLVNYYSGNRVHATSVEDFEKTLLKLINQNHSNIFIVIFDVPTDDLPDALYSQPILDPEHFKPGGFIIPPQSLPNLSRDDIFIEEVATFSDGTVYQARLK